MLTQPFDGHEAALQQLSVAKVAWETEAGGPFVEFILDRSVAPPAYVTERVPVECQSRDIDDMPIFILVHFVDKYLHQYEIFRGDSEPLLRFPEPEQCEVVRPVLTSK